MSNRTETLDEFFDSYAARFNEALQGGKPDTEATAQCFADCFTEASPLGIICKQNDDEFRKVIPEGYKFYREIGVTAMDLISTEITILDDFHAMVKAHWNCEYTRKDNESGAIEFDVIYFVQTLKNKHKIFAYITGDEQQALKDIGLV